MLAARYFFRPQTVKDSFHNPGRDGGPCPPGSSAEAVFTAGCGQGTCVSSLQQAFTYGPKLTYLLLLLCAMGLLLAVVRRARDAGVRFRWPSTGRRTLRVSGPANVDWTTGRPILAHHFNDSVLPFAFKYYAGVAVFQIIVLLWGVMAATPLVEPHPTCGPERYVIDFSGRSICCYAPGMVWLHAGLQSGLALLVLPLARLASLLLEEDNLYLGPHGAPVPTDRSA